MITADAYRSKILPLRAQMEVRNRWLRERLETVARLLSVDLTLEPHRGP